MSSKKYFIPGKLFLAGEYFVVNGDGKAILLALNKGISVKVKNHDRYLLELSNLNQIYDFDPVKSDKDLPNDYVKLALVTVYRYLKEQEIAYKPIHIKVDSSLESSDHASYGFGSSGAIVVALIKSITDYYGLILSKLALFKLSVLAMEDFINYASFADLALSAFSESILYQVFDKVWLKQVNKTSLTKVVEQEWPSLFIEPFHFQAKSYLLVNTKVKTNSGDLVKIFGKKVPSEVYQKSLIEFGELMDVFLLSRDTALLARMQDVYRRIDKENPFGYWVKEYNVIQQICSNANATMKVSGAGGGDNVWVFFDDETEKQLCKNKLKDMNFYIFEDILL